MNPFLRFNQFKKDLEKIMLYSKRIGLNMKGLDIQKIEVTDGFAAFKVQEQLANFKFEIQQLINIVESYADMDIKDFKVRQEEKGSAYGYLGALRGLCLDALKDLRQLNQYADTLSGLQISFNNKSARTVNAAAEGTEHLQALAKKFGPAKAGVLQHSGPTISAIPPVNDIFGLIPGFVMIAMLIRHRYGKKSE
jgi:hypothetical protein